MTGAGQIRADRREPPSAEALFHEAVRLGAEGRFEEALACYERALVLLPRHPGLLYNRGVVLGDLHRHAEALDSFDRALAVQPAFAEAWNNRGFTLQQLKRPADALASFDRALAVTPDFPQALNGRGFVLQQLGRVEEAVASLRQALALWPDYAEARLNLAGALCEAGQIEESFELFRAHAADTWLDSPGAVDAPEHRVRHDREQRAYLAASGDGGAAGFHIRGGERLDGRAVNPGLAADEASRSWTTRSPQIVVVDNLLTDEALAAMRRFCLESTVWRGVYEAGYLGAMPEHGFANPLLAQIARELRETLPAILAPHALRYLWAFKYDSRLTGIGVHADRAAVNVNFWITPDAANLDPASGGLVVWDVAAPLDWDYDAYNADPQAIRAFLARSGARSVTIPYRANRAVIFDSDLFHETDQIRFDEGYENRRVNVTMLYGRRSADNR